MLVYSYCLLNQTKPQTTQIKEAVVSLQTTFVWQDIFSPTKKDPGIAKGCQPSNGSKEH